jgi:tRNA threonylcarbamoyl adenosine modification protein YeaZ
MAQKPLILAVETASRTGSVAIALGEKMLAQATFSAPLRHSAEIFTAIGDLLRQFSRKTWEIQHIYISIGPGSFTGLRIATTLAKTMHLANAARIVPVDTLDVIAANAADCEQPPERIAAILDAKRGQFFIAAYDRLDERIILQQASSIEHEASSIKRQDLVSDMWKKVLPDCLLTASQFVDKFAGGDKPIWLLGDGLLYHRDKFIAEGIRFLDETYWSPRASKVHLLGWNMALANKFADPVTLTPNYICRPDVKTRQR